MFELESINLNKVGEGFVETSTNWKKYFKYLYSAKAFAEKEWIRLTAGRKNPEKIVWTKESGRNHHSQDLGFVQYNIRGIKLED